MTTENTHTKDTIKINDEEIKIPKVYARVKFGWDNEYILPYEQGIALMHIFSKAEKIDSSNYQHHKIVPLSDGLSLSLVSEDIYQKMKMEALLNDD